MPRPIDRRSFATHLLGDRIAVLLLPFPGTLDEFFAADIERRFVLILSQLLDDLSLNRNSCVVSSRQPQRFISLHPFPTRQHVHDRVLQSMAHVQAARDVWRRDDDRVFRRVRVLIYLRTEKTALFPTFIVIFFGRFRIVGLCEFHNDSLRKTSILKQKRPVFISC